MKAKFVVTGEPRGKGRPRFRTFDILGKVKPVISTYTDAATKAYEERIKAAYRQQCRGIRFDDNAMLDMRIIAYYTIPKSETKGNKTAMEAGVIRPTKTPDCDNVLKAIADALNKLAYRDDAQLTDCQIRKFYSYRPRVEVTILHAKNERREI